MPGLVPVRPGGPGATLGGDNLVKLVGPADMHPIESRQDVLDFSTEPLEEPIEVTGRMSAKLFVCSDRPDTDFTAMLTDVYPDGRSMLVADGLLERTTANRSTTRRFLNHRKPTS